MAKLKNWPAICELGRQNGLGKQLMMVIALASDSDLIRPGLESGFPQCFSSTKTWGPVPLSVLVEYARRAAHREGASSDPERSSGFLSSYGALKAFHIPEGVYGWTAEAQSQFGVNPVPAGIDPGVRLGTVVDVDGQPMVVVENNDNPGVDLLYLAPADRIAIDL